MPKYQFLILGENLLIPASNEGGEAQSPCCGFFTTRWAEAASPEQAARQAFELVRKELGDRCAPDPHPKHPATLTVLAASEIDSFEGLPIPGSGFSFFSNSTRSVFERFRERLRGFWQRLTDTAPWTYSEGFYKLEGR